MAKVGEIPKVKQVLCARCGGAILLLLLSGHSQQKHYCRRCRAQDHGKD